MLALKQKEKGCLINQLPGRNLRLNVSALFLIPDLSIKTHISKVTKTSNHWQISAHFKLCSSALNQNQESSQKDCKVLLLMYKLLNSMAPSYRANTPVQYFSPRAQGSSHASFSRYLASMRRCAKERLLCSSSLWYLTGYEFLDVALKLACSLPQTL